MTSVELIRQYGQVVSKCRIEVSQLDTRYRPDRPSLSEFVLLRIRETSCSSLSLHLQLTEDATCCATHVGPASEAHNQS